MSFVTISQVSRSAARVREIALSIVESRRTEHHQYLYFHESYRYT